MYVRGFNIKENLKIEGHLNVIHIIMLSYILNESFLPMYICNIQNILQILVHFYILRRPSFKTR